MKGKSKRISSPCVGVCAIDRGSGICRGCLRTLEEIAQWSRMDLSQKEAVLALLPGRRRAARKKGR